MIYSDQLDILRAERAEIAHCFLISHEEIAELTKENTELKRLMAAQASGWCYVLLLTGRMHQGDGNSTTDPLLSSLRAERNEAAESVLASQLEIDELHASNSQLKNLCTQLQMELNVSCRPCDAAAHSRACRGTAEVNRGLSSVERPASWAEL